MALPALDSARLGMQRAGSLLDSAAARVTRATSVPDVTAPTSAAPVAAAPTWPEDDLVSAVPDLLLARDAMAVQVFSARRADDAYQSVLHLLDR